MKFDEIAQASLLYDFYGQLLTKRQQDVMQLYHEENLSLAEIAEEFRISRQGVHDALKNAEKSLKEYEEKLGLLEKLRSSSEAIEKIDEIMGHAIAQIDSLGSGESQIINGVKKDLKKVRQIIDQLEE